MIDNDAKRHAVARFRRAVGRAAMTLAGTLGEPITTSVTVEEGVYRVRVTPDEDEPVVEEDGRAHREYWAARRAAMGLQTEPGEALRRAVDRVLTDGGEIDAELWGPIQAVLGEDRAPCGGSILLPCLCPDGPTVLAPEDGACQTCGFASDAAVALYEQTGGRE